MKDKLIIIGAGGHGKVCADIAIKMNAWKEIFFLDDNEELTEVIGIKVIGKSIDVEKYIDDYAVFIAIGSNEIRERVFENLVSIDADIVSLIHPSAVIGTDVEIGTGTAVMAGVVINSSSRIGNGCIINTSSSLDHDNVIEDYVHISPGAKIAGSVEIGKSTWLGIGSVVSNNIKIYSGCKIGAGGVVVKDIEISGTYVGIPVRRNN